MILDDDHSKLPVITYRAGYSFAVSVVVVGAVIALVGLLTIFVAPIIGFFMVVAGGFLFSSTYGFQLDKKRWRCREYSSVFWIKRGDWISLDTLPDVSILSGKSGFVVRSMSNRATENTTANYTVYLLSKTHRTKVMVKRFEDHGRAKEFAESLAAEIDGNLKKYSPAVSAQTRRRR
ncbi:MAG: hypothetical protein ABR574_00755 [Cryomorphaceae bacterium]